MTHTHARKRCLPFTNRERKRESLSLALCYSKKWAESFSSSSSPPPFKFEIFDLLQNVFFKAEQQTILRNHSRKRSSLSLLSLSNNFFFYRNDTSKKSGKTDNENIFIPSACQPEMKKNLKFKEERRKEGGGEVLKPEKNTFLLASSWGSSSSNCVFLVLVQFNYILCCCLASSPSQPAPAISRVPILCKINDLSPYMMSKKEQKGKIIKIFFSLQKHNCIPLALLVLFLS